MKIFKKEIYIFSGLGADERVFDLFDFSEYSIHFIKWPPVCKNETIEDYANQLIRQIVHPRPILVGLSFGGIMAIEVAKQIQTEKIILVASVKHKYELPFYYRFLGRFNFHKLLPANILKSNNRIANYLFGACSSFEKNILKQILLDTDSIFLKWAIDKIVKWRNTDTFDNVRHIHGSKDKILPFRYVNADDRIDEGGHLMTLSHTEEIMNVLRKEF